MVKINKDKYIKANELILKSKKLVVLSGAGLDTDSGIPDFRGSNGVYNKTPEDMLDISSMYNNTYNTLSYIKDKLFFPNIKPNTSHHILASLENNNREVVHITQNITKLLEDAGATNVFHIHGTIDTSRCDTCGKIFNTSDIYTGKECNCSKESIVRPNMVFYGEDIECEFEAFNAIKEADLLLILGTSLKVFPAADLPNYTKRDTPIIIITKSDTYMDNETNVLKFNSDISETLQEILYIT